MIYLGIIFILFAGVINGSFVTPGKFIKHLVPSQTWFLHSIIGLIIVPWVIAVLDHSLKLKIYLEIDYTAWLFLFFGGLIFGFGQVCFFKAIHKIGLAKSFAVNLSMGVVIGSMFVVLDQEILMSYQGAMVTTSVLFILIGIVLNYFSVAKKSNVKDNSGWIFAFLAGIASGIQNIVFYKLSFLQQLGVISHSLFWIWPPFLLFASLPMMFYFLSENTFLKAGFFGTRNLFKNFSLIILMGLLFTGSLFLYSKGMGILTLQYKSIGWPIFMICIILASQAWGIFFKEAKHDNVIYKTVSVVLLILAIIILSIKY